jgi:hypothetical protein
LQQAAICVIELYIIDRSKENDTTKSCFNFAITILRVTSKSCLNFASTILRELHLKVVQILLALFLESFMRVYAKITQKL